MKTIWVTGSKGQLGTELKLQQSKLKDVKYIFTDIEELDLTNEKLVTEFAQQHKPDFIINCAAYTAVDKAETDQDFAFKLNKDIPKYLCNVSKSLPCIFIHISTDYVFAGNACVPYTEEIAVAPQSVYANSKLAGEIETMKNPDNIIIRTSWLYSAHGGNFAKTMLRLGKERESLNVVFDQIGTPTSAADLADALLKICADLIATGKKAGGIYHFSNEGVCSWFDFAVEIMKMAGLNCKVYPITSDKYPTPTKRPEFSVLNKNKIKTTFGLEISHWRTSMEPVLKTLLAN